ncbi:MAG TPA: cytochrome o ubiquinol oxidase subunit III [Candidatus Paceibacterota bacterium]|nr:cytochrome o ubiquinol oxidase subunit III [Candidatus Paceibacterota bacterium]
MSLKEQNEKTVFGFWVYLMSDCVLFAGLFAAYAVLWRQAAGGPQAFELANMRFVFVETLILLSSSFMMGLSVVAAHAKKKALAVWLLLSTLALGLAFLGMEAYEFSHLVAERSGPSRSAFLSSYFALVGTHGLHVLAGSLWMISLIVYLARRGFTNSGMRKLAMLSLFWHFLDIIWIFIFTFVYLFGALAL